MMRSRPEGNRLAQVAAFLYPADPGLMILEPSNRCSLAAAKHADCHLAFRRTTTDLNRLLESVARVRRECHRDMRFGSGTGPPSHSYPIPVYINSGGHCRDN